MSIPFAVLQLDHVVLRSADPARLEDFYVRVLGCPVEKRQDNIGLTQLRAGRALIDILALKLGETTTGSAKGNMDHLCLRIEPFDASDIHAHLKAHGIAYGEIAPRFGADGRGPSIYIEDPDGNRVELKGPPVS
jgi:glyoxylase I family protein